MWKKTFHFEKIFVSPKNFNSNVKNLMFRKIHHVEKMLSIKKIIKNFDMEETSYYIKKFLVKRNFNNNIKNLMRFDLLCEKIDIL